MTAITGIKNSKRGFAGMSLEKRRRIAGMGGRAAHDKGTAHKWTTETASIAGRIGGNTPKGSRQKIKAELE